MEKVAHLLEHWISHSREHTQKYVEWAEKLKETSPETSELLLQAAKKFREGEMLLEKALHTIRQKSQNEL
jgi:hypothetical protein